MKLVKQILVKLSRMAKEFSSTAILYATMPAEHCVRAALQFPAAVKLCIATAAAGKAVAD